jgi:hypothetical protein
MGYAARANLASGQPRPGFRARGRRPLLEQPGAICVVSGDRTTYPQFAANVATVQSTRGSFLFWHLAGGGELAHARNNLVQKALTAGARWVWFIDDDHVFALDVLGRLLRHDVDIVVPAVLMRKPPHAWVAWDVFDIPPEASDAALVEAIATAAPLTAAPRTGGLVELGFCGAAGALIRAEVFESLAAPWFEFGRLGGTLPGEDTWFCTCARRAGFQIWCDTDTAIGHLTTTAIWPTRHPYTGAMGVNLDFDFDGTSVRKAGASIGRGR